MNDSYTYKPVVIIGAARSGTKILRDTLALHNKIDAIPYDVNYIWRIGNTGCIDDVLLVEQTPRAVIERIRRKLFSFGGKGEFLLEKTVSNTIRIPFVLSVFPEARFIHLIRDGREVVESVIRQWGETRGIQYFFKKIKDFPILDSFGYLLKYAFNWIRLLMKGKPEKDYIWGVKYPGYKEDLSRKSVAEVCAIQWKACVEESLKELDQLERERVCEVRYEDFVHNPKAQSDRIFRFLGLDGIDEDRLTHVISESRSKFTTRLSEEDQSKILRIIKPTLKDLNYIID